MYFDRVKYTATQVQGKVFTVTAASGFSTFSEGVRSRAYIKDSSGNGISADVAVYGSQLNVLSVFRTTESDGTIPTFGSGIEVISSVGAEEFDKKDKVGALVYGPAQSNAVGYDQTAYSTAWDYVDARIREYAYDTSYLAAADEGYRIAETPLHWPVRNPTHDAVSSATHFARELVTKGGWGGIDILPCAQGATASSAWGTSSTLTLRMLQMMEDHLNADENHEIACIVWQLGETDGLFSTPQSNFETFMENFKSNVESEILSRTGKDITQVPWVVVGMARIWYSGISGREGIQRALQSAPGRMDRSAFVSTDLLTANPGDDVHMSNEAQREVAPRLFEGYLRALGNIINSDVYGNIHKDGDDVTSSASGTVGAASDIFGTINETLDGVTSSANGTVSGSGISGSINVTLDGVTCTASGTNSSGSSRPNTDAISGGTAYYANEGVTTDASGNVTGWDDYFGNHDMTFPNPDASCTDGGAAGLSFDGTTAASEGGRISGAQQNGNECSVLVKFKGTAGYLLAGLNMAVYLGSGGTGASSYVQGSSSSVDHDASGNEIDDDVTHTLSVTRDASGNIVAILDGTEIHNTTGTQAKSTENIRVGTSAFGGGFNGTVEFIYFNDTTALSSTQIANIFSEV